MRRKDREIKDIDELESIMKKAKACRIGLCDQNKPYVVPVSFGYQDGCLYFHSAREGKKINILKENKNVCFEVDIDVELVKSRDPCGWSMKYRSVIGFGAASFIVDSEDKKNAMDIIMSHYSDETGDFNYSPKMLGVVAIIRIDIREMTGKKAGYPD